MAGIYIHIPFCKQACSYCNFHFSTSVKMKRDLISAILKELKLTRNYLPDPTLHSIYLGGGTPSLLTVAELQSIFTQLARLYSIHPDCEITLEANPDDLSANYLNELRLTPVNRLSIGIQSFHEHELRFMNRAHSAKESQQCLEVAITAGFENLSADLIFGIPGSSVESWRFNLEKITSFPIQHLSCYNLTIEEKTVLHHKVSKGKIDALDEETTVDQFNLTAFYVEKNGFEHYEISNYSKPGHRAIHNTSYWNGTPYLGIGPSAHSFNGKARRWNVANNALYIRWLNINETPFEEEKLTTANRINERIMTSLRLREGLDLSRYSLLVISVSSM